MPSGHLTIGALARASGVPTATLRTWERRYGFPNPARDDGGQRLYDPELVARVRDVAAAIRLGWRPAQAFAADLDEIRKFVGQSEPSPLPAPVPAPRQPMAGWFAAIEAGDDVGFGALVLRDLERLGVIGFVDQQLVPFFAEVSAAQRAGRLSVFHEHQASERIRTLLAARWRDVSDRSRGPVVFCAAAPEERHDLGLHCAALVLAVSDTRIAWSGADTPVADIVGGARAAGAAAVLIGVSPCADRGRTSVALRAIRDALSPEVPLWVGGATTGLDALANSGEQDGIVAVNGLRELEWLRARLSDHAAGR